MPRVLFLGDIVGRPGREAVVTLAASLRESHRIDLIVANGENAAGGAGITGRIARELHAAGVDGLTLGDHTWDQRGFESEIAALEHLCRPANLPEAQPGRTHLILKAGSGFRLGVFTVLGRTFMGPPVACPFATADALITRLKPECDALLVEIHAEATSEKIALGRHLDGRASIVVGTHTHVPTADASLLPKGTAYITDVGMSGPYDSVLGREVAPVISKFLDGLPRRFEVATGDVRLSGLLVELSPETGMAVQATLLTQRLPSVPQPPA